MGNFHSALKHYKDSGLVNDEKMWKCIASVDGHIETMEERYPGEFRDFMREQHEIFCGPHFDERFAEWQVKRMHYKDSAGKEHRGGHWTLDEAKDVFNRKKAGLPDGTTVYDVFVAINGNYCDKVELFRKWMPERYEQMIIDDAIVFYFEDDDAPDGKVWYYMEAMDRGG